MNSARNKRRKADYGPNKDLIDTIIDLNNTQKYYQEEIVESGSEKWKK